MAWSLLSLSQVSKKGVRRPFPRRLRLEALEDRLNLAALPTGFSESLVAGGLSSPTAMEFAPDGRLFVAQQTGALRVIQNGSLLPTPFVTLPVNSSGERGLLGVAFDPNFATNQFVYVYYTATTPAIHNRISRFTANGNVAAAGSEVVIMDLENLSATNHNGGAIHFGPDGKLYAAVGENAVGSNSQTLNNRLGKMLRINADGSIPTDNPFFNQATGLNRSIWALGLRNPFTFTFQPGTGRMFINDVGQNTWEEINDGLAGANYGWPSAEGPSGNPSFANPLFVYGHGSGPTVGCAITGGAFYNPAIAAFPDEYTGDYFFADFCGGWIRRFDPITSVASSFATGISSPVDLKVTSDGSLYYLSRGSGGQVWRVTYTPQVIDNGESGFSTTGAWTPFPGQGHLSDVHYSHFSSGPAVATWSFGVTPGQFRIWATWSEHLNRATDAPFTIVDDNSPLATVAVNQELAPNDLNDAGTVWEELGVYNITTSALLVQLANNANEYVIADAVRILRLGNLPAAPEIQVFLGPAAIADGSGSVDFGTTLPGTPVTRTFTVRNAGTQTLTLLQPISVPSGFTLASTFGSTSLAPGVSTTFAVRLDAAAAGNFSGQVSFGNNDADENPFNFSVSGIVSALPAPLIVDNRQAGFSTPGWAFYPGQGYENGVHYIYPGGGSEVAAWAFSGLSSGEYRVSATWSAHPNRATDAPFSILDGSVPLATVSMNQELMPNDLNENGVDWEDLGVFQIAGNSLVVRLNNYANEYVIADAVRIQRMAGLPSAPEIQVLDGEAPLADGSSSVEFGATRMGTPVTKTFTVRNAGAQTLTLSQPISVPAGFTLVSSFGSTSLAQGASTTFAVRLDAAAAGSFSGQISFGNNDADENPFNFSVSGSVNPLDAPLIIDNRQAGFSATSGWLFYPGQGYRDGVNYVAAEEGRRSRHGPLAV